MPGPPPIEAFGVRDMVSDSSSRRKRISVNVGQACMDSNPFVLQATYPFPKMPFPGHFLSFRIENPGAARLGLF
jgi:hypothetical protein